MAERPTDTATGGNDEHDRRSDAAAVRAGASRRQRERGPRVESVLDRRGSASDGRTSRSTGVDVEDLPADTPDDRGSLDTVPDRPVGERFDTPAAAREAALNELTGERSGFEGYEERPVEGFGEPPASG